MPPNRNNTPEVPATRLACDRCHDHKLRCDRSPIAGEPCRRCARVKAECRYGRPRRFGRPRKRRDSESVKKEDSITGASPVTPAAPCASESAVPPQELMQNQNDSSVVAGGVDSPSFFEVEDSSFGQQPVTMSMMPEAELPSSAEMMLSEGVLYAEPPASSVVDDTDWLGAHMAAHDIDLSLFTDFDPNDLMFTTKAPLPTPPNSPDCDSDCATPASGCTSHIFSQYTAPESSLRTPVPAVDLGHSGDVMTTLTQLQLRLHQISTLPKEPLLDDSSGRCTLIEETIKAFQIFNETLRRMCQPFPLSPSGAATPISPYTPTPAPTPAPGWSPSSEKSPPSFSGPTTTTTTTTTIDAATSLLTLVCYVRIIQSCKDVLLLLRRALDHHHHHHHTPETAAAVFSGSSSSPPHDSAASTSLASIAPLLPQIRIGSIAPPSSPRIQVALLAQLLASMMDEARDGLGQLAVVSAAGGTDSYRRHHDHHQQQQQQQQQQQGTTGGCKGMASVVGGHSASPEGEDRPVDGRPAADLLRLAEEGIWRDEAELKRQMLAITSM